MRPVSVSRRLPMTPFFHPSTFFFKFTFLCFIGFFYAVWHRALRMGISRKLCIWTTCSHQMSVLILLLLIIRCETSLCNYSLSLSLSLSLFAGIYLLSGVKTIVLSVRREKEISNVCFLCSMLSSPLGVDSTVLCDCSV